MWSWMGTSDGGSAWINSAIYLQSGADFHLRVCACMFVSVCGGGFWSYRQKIISGLKKTGEEEGRES